MERECKRCGALLPKGDEALCDHWGYPIDNVHPDISKFPMTEPKCIGAGDKKAWLLQKS
jgi:hypothetical protein